MSTIAGAVVNRWNLLMLQADSYSDKEMSHKYNSNYGAHLVMPSGSPSKLSTIHRAKLKMCKASFAYVRSIGICSLTIRTS